ncbi:MAG: sulfatase-like hydrolase/transferase [Candidatus Heimdallarchaeota archaeon]|nr:sulfatase-like hydrolase/transferase [Candidatus Heimdallarchaeota archaeon]
MNQRKKINLLLIWFVLITLFLLSLGLRAAATQYHLDNPLEIKEKVTPRELIDNPAPVSNQVLIFFIDGMRYDKMNEANTPNIDSLKSTGITFSNFRSVLPSYSRVNYAAFASGTSTNITGVMSNGFTGPIDLPNLFSVAQKEGLTTGIISTGSWNQLFQPWINVSIEVSGEYHSPNSDLNIRDAALATLPNNFTNIQFVGFNDVDALGHLYGAKSEEYLAGIEKVDEYIGEIIDLYQDFGQLQNTTIVLFSDHGMADDKGHGGEADDQTHASLILGGEGITNPGSTITREVRINAVAPTLLSLLGAPIASTMNGLILFDSINISLKSKAIYAIQLAEIITHQFAVSFPKMNILTKSAKSFYSEQLGIIQNNISTIQEMFQQGAHLEAFNQATEINNYARTIFSNLLFQYSSLMRLTRSMTIIGTITLGIIVLFLLNKKQMIKIHSDKVLSKKLLLPQILGTASFFIVTISIFSIAAFTYDPKNFNSVAEPLVPNLSALFIGGGTAIFLPWLIINLLQKKNGQKTFKTYKADFLRASIGSLFFYSLFVICYAFYYIYRYGFWPRWSIPKMADYYAFMIISVLSCILFITAIVLILVLQRIIRKNDKIKQQPEITEKG